VKTDCPHQSPSKAVFRYSINERFEFVCGDCHEIKEVDEIKRLSFLLRGMSLERAGAFLAIRRGVWHWRGVERMNTPDEIVKLAAGGGLLLLDSDNVLGLGAHCHDVGGSTYLDAVKTYATKWLDEHKPETL